MDMPNLSGKKILLVDDDELVHRMFSTFLQKSGADIVEAMNGAEALAKLAAGKFDLVLLDLIMPVMDGCETLEHIKADPIMSKVPVMVLTNLDDTVDHIDRARALGVADYLHKTDMPLEEIGQLISERLARA